MKAETAATVGVVGVEMAVPEIPWHALSRPARGLAILGDVANKGAVITCEHIAPIIVHAYRVYEYVGVSDGMAIYHEIGELKELEAEQADRQITGGDR